MIDDATRDLVRRRAGERCEYCHLPEHAGDVPFYIEHIIAQQHKQDDSPSNLALACDRCNLHKGPDLSSVDPASDEKVFWFNPRTDEWGEHFMFRTATIVGLTPPERATVALLKMNARRRQELRRELLNQGERFRNAHLARPARVFPCRALRVAG